MSGSTRENPRIVDSSQAACRNQIVDHPVDHMPIQTIDWPVYGDRTEKDRMVELEDIPEAVNRNMQHMVTQVSGGESHRPMHSTE